MSEAGRAVARVELEAVVGEALRAWQREHPRATLDEIVAAVDTALLPVRRRALRGRAYIGDLAAAEEAAVLAGQRCPECGEGMQQRADARRAAVHVREVLAPGQAPAVRLERLETVCSSCGRSLFPPRCGAGVAAWQPESAPVGGARPCEQPAAVRPSGGGVGLLLAGDRER